MKWLYGNPIFEYGAVEVDPKSPWAGHKVFAYDLVSALTPRVVVELGTYRGTSFFSMCQAVKDRELNTKLFAIDTWQGDVHGGHYGNEIFEHVQQQLASYYSGVDIALIRKTFNDARGDFADQSIDLLHIDGLHTYDAVKHDFDTWLPKVAPQGIILFHDIHVRQGDFGVHVLWDELKKKYATMEFYHSSGLGVLFLDPQIKQVVAPLETIWQRYYALTDDYTKQGIDAAQYLYQLVHSKQDQEKVVSEKGILQAERDVLKAERDVLQAERNILVHQILQEREVAIKEAQIMRTELLAQIAEQQKVFLDQYKTVQTELLSLTGKTYRQETLLKEKDVELADTRESYTREIQSKEVTIATLKERERYQTNAAFLKEKELDREITISRRQIEVLTETVSQTEKQLALIHASKFWKLQGLYFRAKWGVYHPLKFAKKYLWGGIPTYKQMKWATAHPLKFVKKYVKFFLTVTQRVRHNRARLVSEASYYIRHEGVRKTVRRVRNYLLYGKGSSHAPAHPVVTADPYHNDYYRWIKGVEQPFKQKLFQEKESLLVGLTYLPKISVLMPTYNSNEIFFRKAVFSVINQWYPNWELCIVDDHSSDTVMDILFDELLARNDSRIRIQKRNENGGISVATNQAAEQATGEFLAFLDHDDEIESYALLLFVLELQKNKNIDVAYSDSDKMSQTGYRHDPEFKPDWSPELLLSVSYISHFRIIRKKLFNQVGGLNKAFDGAQDYDLALRLTEHTQKVLHIPWVLYHWRALPGSMALASNEKPRAQVAGLQAVHEAVTRRNIPGSAILHPDARGNGIYKVVFDQNKIHDKVSIIIPTKDAVNVLRKCIESIKNLTRYMNYEIVVINNNSEKAETFEYFKTGDFRVVDIPTPSFNFSLINNRAVDMVDSEYVVFLNNDTEIINPDWLLEFLGTMKMRDEVAIVGGKLLYPNDTIQHAGVVLLLANGLVASPFYQTYDRDHPGHLNDAKMVRNYSAVTAACMMVRKSVFKKLGGFNEQQLAVAYNDVDLCLRAIKAGYACVYNPGVLLYHHESLTRKFGEDINEINYMLNTWAPVYPEYDPYLNKHFMRRPPHNHTLKEG